MPLKHPSKACLREVLKGDSGEHGQTEYLLTPNRPTVIGRDSDCHIVLDSSQYKKVSRRHVEIRPLITPLPNEQIFWRICDLESANGTYLDGRRIWDSKILQPGAHIRLGYSGPEFVFELGNAVSAPVNKRLATQISEVLHLSQIFPVIRNQQNLLHKAQLIPGIITVLFVVGAFAANGHPQIFNWLLGIYLIAAAYYFIYSLSGKLKAWWLLLGTGLFTILFLLSPLRLIFFFIFRKILPGGIAETNVLTLLINQFFGAGLMEELIKALPVFAILMLGKQLKSPWRERVGVWEPLDGILLGTASAAGFTILETLGQYIPRIIELAGNESTGNIAALQLLIPRILGSTAGHMAYSGYFGYFIGLSVLKPSKRWRIIGIGYLTAASLHTLWNASSSINYAITAIAGILAYVFLMAAVLKARQLSPTRSQNFATQINRSKR